MKFAPGIHLDLPEAEYLSVEALSQTGVKWLHVSPTDFWARTSWLNPVCEDEQSIQMVVGKAYHARIVEGKSVFASRYAAEPDKSQAPAGTLFTMEDLRAEAKGRGLKTGGTKADLTERLITDDPNTLVWDEMVADYRGDHNGKTFLPADLIGRIEIAAAMVEKDPVISKAFQGGYPEVSIFWEVEGVPMKARMDYLKPRVVVDLKTFSNPYGRPINRAVATAFASGRYHVQAATYWEASGQIPEFIAQGLVSGKGADDFCERFAKPVDRDVLFVFQQTGVAPVVKAKLLPKQMLFDCGKITLRDAREKFKECMKVFGKEIWLEPSEIESFDDSEIPSYAVE